MALDISLPLKPQTVAAINAIGTAYGTEGLRNALAAYPSRIKSQREVVAQARATYRNAEQARAEQEAALILDISVATDDKGKPRYSNAEARAAALSQIKRDDGDYCDALDNVRETEAAVTEAQDTLQMLLDEYQSARIAGRLIAAEMSALSEIIDVGEREEVSAKGAVEMEIPGVDDAATMGGFGIGKPVTVSSHKDSSKQQQKEAF